MENNVKEEIKTIHNRLREIAKQNLIDRDWWNISDEDIKREMERLLWETE